MRSRDLALPAAALAACVVSTQALSQERQIGGVGLTVFADRNFRGESATLRGDTPNLSSIRMNDAVSSLRVGPGERWEVCEEINYRGRCVVVSGSEADLRQNGWGDRISSARRIAGGGRRGGRGPIVPGVQGLELFSGTRFSGDHRSFRGAQSDLRRLGFNDVAQSLRIGRGEYWEVCDDINFAKCRVVSGDSEDLRRQGMSRRISSVRPVRRR
jgi:hypothetical protein